MSHKSARLRRALSTLAVATVTVVIIISAAVGTYVALNPAAQRTTTTTANASSAFIGSVTGLELRVSLNASTINLGDSISFNATVFNTRATENNLSSISDWTVPQPVIGPCGPTDAPIAFAVIQGYYTQDNVSQAPRVGYGVECTTDVGNVEYYSFEPSSDEASIIGASCNPSQCSASPIALSRSVGGYWTNGVMEKFTPGAYTVVVEDEWGQTALSHFVVRTQMQAESSTSTSSWVTASNATVPIPGRFGKVFTSNFVSFIGANGYGFYALTIDTLSNNETGVGLDCSDISGSGGQIGPNPYPLDYQYSRMNCYEVNSTTDYHVLLLDTVQFNLSIVSPSDYRFEVTTNASGALVPQEYNWSFGDGTFGITSNSGQEIEHSYSSSGGFNVTLHFMVKSNSPAGDGNWTLTNGFIITITVPEIHSTSTTSATVSTSERTNAAPFS